MKSKLYLAAVAITATALFNGCAKDGAVGPQGPQGNANVIGTNSATVTWTLINNNTQYSALISAPGITADIVSNGSVQVFIQYGTEWWALPDIEGINSTIFGFGLDNYGNGYISLLNSNSDGSEPDYPSHSTFRVVIISASARMAHPNVNWKNYTEVKAALGLKD